MQQATKPYKLITSIEVLSVDRFITCVCDGNLDVLVLSGEAPLAEKAEAWGNLYAQYLDVLGDTETLYILNLQRETQLLEFKITTAEAIIPILRMVFVHQLATDLKTLGFKTKSLSMGNPGYDHNLQQIESRLVHLRLKHKEKAQELDQYYKDQSTETVSRQFFTRQLQRLSKYQGYPLRPKSMMVTEYVEILKDYLSQAKVSTDGKEREDQ